MLYNGDLTFLSPIFTAMFLVVLQLFTYFVSVIVLGVKVLVFLFFICVSLFYFFYINIVASVTSSLGIGRHIYEKAIGLVFIWWNS